MESKDEMTEASSRLQDLRRGIYVKAKAEPSWRFWGLYVHVCKMETLQEAYAMAKKNNGAPGIDGVTFEDVEAQGAERYIEQIRNELTERTYVPLRARKKEIPKDGQSPRPVDPCHSRPRGTGGAQADTGADLRG
jgi:RNA-directed DNA polymerase